MTLKDAAQGSGALETDEDGARYEAILFGKFWLKINVRGLKPPPSSDRSLDPVGLWISVLHTCFKFLYADLDDTLYPLSSGLAAACRRNIEGIM